MASAGQSQIDRLRRELADLNKADTREAKKEADLVGKLNRAQEAAGRTKSASILSSKLHETERAMDYLAAVRKKRAEISGKLAGKSKNLRSYEDRQAKEDERAPKRLADEQKRLIREREAHERSVRNLLSTHHADRKSFAGVDPRADLGCRMVCVFSLRSGAKVYFPRVARRLRVQNLRTGKPKTLLHSALAAGMVSAVSLAFGCDRRLSTKSRKWPFSWSNARACQRKPSCASACGSIVRRADYRVLYGRDMGRMRRIAEALDTGWSASTSA